MTMPETGMLRASAGERLMANWPLVLSGSIVALVVVAVLFAPLLAGYDPAQMLPRDRLQPPSWSHPFGTDQFGRDVLSRIIYGARTSLEVALSAVTIAVVVGGAIGLLAGYLGGWFDAVVVRLLDVLIAFPSLLLALFIVAVLGADLVNLILAISLTRVPYFARLARAETAAMVQRPFVTAALARPSSTARTCRSTPIPRSRR
jgi:peptide/nickel transport system permease protein